ncbi:hypothetical protein MATR_37530 [Marivirga tractuosa]|uniref:Lipocalin-like domain-containing protein n=1 Tax=Marivirga tractuosa (strain ATCC 23168 / DSM 4126 / NBRC 15989 / NCIMB 1408 / VKM B-1430 / H-43) TaxID=643867 RepID=E4TME2_MARTH|nr:hypothetical protein [Marivirga tractuosa]ADR22401.1 hypothetical protein Ftrac_2423 [Marivirga tractuosa DSM 4126]BDD16928.1 hypothetical protein MATR_37530 [Marivirga tractuosa]|tara:strand:+ start:176 stop:514 length:339 start_codon:yes stop_codon:yes gene_type:complete
MEVYQNLLEGIQGKWNCTKAINQYSDQSLNIEFSLLISENLISRSGQGDQYWPSISNFELVGSIKDGYFYREDGCFLQVKSLTENQMVIELSHKSSEGQLIINNFTFTRDRE